MALSITPFAHNREATARIAWPSLFEALFTLMAIAAMLPLFRVFSTNIAGRDGRFAENLVSVGGLPAPVLPVVCSDRGASAEALVRASLCEGISPRSATGSGNGMPLALVDANARTKAAFGASLQSTQARLAELRLQLREGAGDVLQLSSAIDAAEAQIRPFVQRYSIDTTQGTAPVPLACAYEIVAATLASPESSRSREGGETARANALLMLAAAFDGDAATAAIAASALLPEAPRSTRRLCVGWRLSEALSRASAAMADARHASTNGAKNEAMRELLGSAGWQWAGAMLVGLGLLNLSRRRDFAGAGVALALATWAVAAWLGRVPWPFAAERAFVPGRETVAPAALPAPFVVWLLALALAVAVIAVALRKALRSSPQTIASRVGYPGFVVATGVGWLLLLDLSANGAAGNRYLALYHHGHLWFGMLLLTLVAFARQPLGRALSWVLAILDGLGSGIGRRLGKTRSAVVAVLVMLALIAAFGALLANRRQVTSELGRLWLMLGAAWFFFLRGAPFAERLARSGRSLVSLARYVFPLGFVVVVLIGAMVLTRDMGPLLIAGYAAGAFVAASTSMWMHERYRATHVAYALGIGVFVGWILIVTLTLFRVGAVDDVTAARLENVAAPLASANDQLALIAWFQQVTPQTGFGLGAVPWCGYGASTGCAGVPAQIQSDYTFTAIFGAFGATAAWATTLGCALWLHRLIRHHGRVTRGEPRLVAASGRIANDEQALLSWLAVTWVVLTLCQLAVTVAGNVAVIPLTGVTFPFVSFGMTSLLANIVLLALCLNVNLPQR